MEDYSILPVKSSEDIPTLARVFLQAITQIDTFWEVLTRYRSDSLDTFIAVLKESLDHPNHHLLKAVHNVTGDIVGMAQWKAPWYLEIEKTDPFAMSNEQPAGDVTVVPLLSAGMEGDDPAKAKGVAMFNESMRQMGNAYITHIRGKKHVCE